VGLDNRPVEPRLLIVNADDLGLCGPVDEGIFAAHERGIVTSASLMVRQGTAASAARAAAARPGLAIGLHLDLGQWHYLDGERIQARGRLDPASREAVEAECRAQLELFRSLLGRDPTHLDSHKHVHRAEPVVSVAAALADELAVPLRGREVRYEGGFYGRDGEGRARPDSISPDALIALAASLSSGWTELGCHPAAGPVPSSYDEERRVELATLCEPRVRAALAAAGVELRSFAELSAGRGRRG
jgi:chitin disaccharide deacetylase